MSLEKGGIDSEMDSVDAPATVAIIVPTPAYPFLSPPARPDEIGRLGNYRVLRLLNQGGMAYVFLAEDRDLKRKVALKVMKPSVSKDMAGTQRFLREARLLASIKHEHIVTVYQVSQDSPTIFLAMEWLRGQTLEERINLHGPPTNDEILRIAREIACGLDVIHCNGLIHRDLKPNNIWVEDPRQHVKLLDFGLVRAISDDNKLTGAGFVIGTPGYMSPEQARGYPLDPRSDLFSLGAVLYFLCTGRQPFESDSSVGTLTAVVIDQPKHVCELNPRVPRILGDLVMQLLEKAPANRPSSAEDVILRLSAIQKNDVSSHQTEILHVETQTNSRLSFHSGETEKIISPKSINQTRRPLNRHRRRKVALLGTAIGLSLVLTVLFSRGGWKKPAETLVAGELRANEREEVAGKTDEIRHDSKTKPLAFTPGIIVLDDCDRQSKGKESYEDRLSFVSPDGAKKFRITGFNVMQDIYNAHRIATDSKHDCFWVIENSASRIRRFDLNGKEKPSIVTPMSALAIAVDAESGNLWATFQGTRGLGKTAIYSPDGELLEMINQSGTEIVYDSHAKAFWIANPILTKYSAITHRKVLTVDVLADCVPSMAVDARDGSIWVATRDLSDKPTHNKVMKFDSSGELLADIGYEKDMPKKITLDPRDGSVWVLRANKSLEHYDSKGSLLKSVISNACTVQADPKGGDIWIVTPDEIARLNSKGDKISQLRHPTRTVDAWIAAME